ncbi:Fic family protein [Bacteroides sp. GM023]|uniref:Fic/DOC family protein n=1 Tax=Bacteroides sp. GM023 TaxID=2723058 RepID=UPI001CC283AC|nr:Fic family protein [Bacteroides sp. GM023]
MTKIKNKEKVCILKKETFNFVTSLKDMPMSKYEVNQNESDILPNLLHLTNAEDIALAELEGFMYAELFLENELDTKTHFNSAYICRIHELAFKDLYSFAGKYRTTNISKGGFVFPAALYIPQSMENFEKDILQKLPDKYDNRQQLIEDIAKVHAELLFIHPFREGNGRTARILANIMAIKQGYAKLDFSPFTGELFPSYIEAVQRAADMNYTYMEKIIEKCFEDDVEPFDK